jgi:hypothetical protein
MFAVACIPTFMAGPLNGKHKTNILCALCGFACPMKSLLHLFHRGGE